MKKKSNDIRYGTAERLLMKFHIKHLYDGSIRFSETGNDLKFKTAVMPIKVRNHSGNFYSRTTGLVWLIFCLKHIGDFPI